MLCGENTGLTDHTGEELLCDDKCYIDCGHTNFGENEKGIIIFSRGSFFFRYLNGDGDLLLSSCYQDLEKII
ncbi:MAG: hypothetical protein GY787_24000 [Alteromonadales bacterium]|nr:hypothetical protein [Alteromonadales bacterium]